MHANQNPADLNRRQFLLRSAKAGACVAAACVTGYHFYDADPPGPPILDEAAVSLPDYSIAGLGPKMSIVRGANRTESLELGLKSLGGIEAFVQKGDRILLKVNAAFASPPLIAATTHPDLVAAVVRLCLKAGAAAVVVTDNPINDPTSCFQLTGIDQAARAAGARVILPQESAFRPATVPAARLIRNWPLLWEPFRQVNKLIGIATVKDHHRSGASMTMKNWYGLLGGRRNIFHQDVHNLIKELAMLVRPTLVILDGTVSMMRNGPTGGSLADLKQTETLIVSTDQVAADAFGATLLDKSAAELAFIAKAEQIGAGTSDFRSLNPIMISAG